jgi:hypothetical protein
MSFRKRLGPDPRAVSNVEAEKGETVLTNLSRGLNNIVEFYEIGGKKHGEKGTPLALPTNDNGSGASFVFSDRIKVSNPAVLEFFNAGSKPKTIAELSKKQLDVINSGKKLLLDKTSDKITRDTVEHNMKTAMTELQLLKVLQESTKGFPNGLPNGTEDLFQKMGISPEEFLNIGDDQKQLFAQAEKKALGGIVRKLPLFSGGGDVSQFGDKDPNAKTQYLYIRDVLGKSKDAEGFKKALFEEYKKIMNDPDQYGEGYRSIMGDEKAFSKIKLNTPDEVYNAYLDMQYRNLVFKSQGYDVAGTEHNPSANKAVPAWAEKHGVPIPGMDETAKQQIAYRAFEKLAENQGSYSEELQNVLRPFQATQFGSSDDRFRGQPSSVSLADGAYTNTSAGQISKFTPPKNAEVKNDKIVWEGQPKGETDPAKPAVVTPEADPQKRILEQPLDYRSQDLRSLGRAMSALMSTPMYQSFRATPDIPLFDAAYYSPERSIAAINESVNSAEDLSRSFADAQGATSAGLELAGKSMEATANVISDYADKNVGVFNSTAQANQQLAAQRNALEAEAQNQTYAENVAMKERFRQSIQAAKDKIVDLKNTAETNMANIYNLNIMNENFKKDPFTGLVYRTDNDQSYNPDPSGTADPADELNQFMKQVPSLSPDMAAKVYMGMKSGKWTIQDDGVLTPDELNRSNAGV